MIGEFVYGLMQTEGAVLPTVLRVALGIVIFPHGAQKLCGFHSDSAPARPLNPQ